MNQQDIDGVFLFNVNGRWLLNIRLMPPNANGNVFWLLTQHIGLTLFLGIPDFVILFTMVLISDLNSKINEGKDIPSGRIDKRNFIGWDGQ